MDQGDRRRGRHDDPDPRALDRQMLIFGLGVIATAVLAFVLPDLVPAQAHGAAADLAHGRVIALVHPSPGPTDQPLPSDGAAPDGAASGDQTNAGDGNAPAQARFVFLDGPRSGQEDVATIQGPNGSLALPDYGPGDQVVVETDTQPDGSAAFALVDRWRIPLFEILLGAFAVVAAVVAGWRGMRAIVALALTLVLVLRVFVPLVILGWNPVALAIVFGIAVTILTFILTQGLNRTTVAAIAGTTLGLGLTGVLAAVVTEAAHFTAAQGSDEVVYLSQVTNGTIDLSGLLLAAVIFGGLGVLNDVAISQAATVEELHAADPGLARRELFLRSMNVGVAHVAATINTLVFAYLGTALPLVVLLVLEVSNLAAAASGEQIAVEVIRTIVGAIGVLAAVPITTAIACRLVPSARNLGDWSD